MFLPELAGTLTNLAALDRLEDRLDDSREQYQEGLSLFVRLSQGDDRYTADVARVQASLLELDGNGPAATERQAK